MGLTGNKEALVSAQADVDLTSKLAESARTEIRTYFTFKRRLWAAVGAYIIVAVTAFGVYNIVQQNDSHRAAANQLTKIVSTLSKTNDIDTFVQELEHPTTAQAKATAEATAKEIGLIESCLENASVRQTEHDNSQPLSKVPTGCPTPPLAPPVQSSSTPSERVVPPFSS